MKSPPDAFALVEWLPDNKYKRPLLESVESVAGRLAFTSTHPSIDFWFSVVMQFHIKSLKNHDAIAIRFLVPEKIVPRLEIGARLPIFDGKQVATAAIVEFVDQVGQ